MKSNKDVVLSGGAALLVNKNEVEIGKLIYKKNDQEKCHLEIAKKYKNFYPNYYIEIVKEFLRNIFYRLI